MPNKETACQGLSRLIFCRLFWKSSNCRPMDLHGQLFVDKLLTQVCFPKPRGQLGPGRPLHLVGEAESKLGRASASISWYRPLELLSKNEAQLHSSDALTWRTVATKVTHSTRQMVPIDSIRCSCKNVQITQQCKRPTSTYSYIEDMAIHCVVVCYIFRKGHPVGPSFTVFLKTHVLGRFTKFKFL